jgi:hypothetical protein
MAMLNRYAQKFKVPKNKIIEAALTRYMEALKRAEFVRGFKRAGGDAGQLELAEEGLGDFLAIIERYEAR